MSTTAVQHPPARRQPSQLRLTRRGRLVVLGFAALIILALGFFVAAGSVASQERGAERSTEVVTVAPGDTLWDIAAGISDGDVRATMSEIQRLNALDSGALQAGQKLLIPAAD